MRRKFRKKSFVIEASQWWKNGDHPEDHVGEQVPDPVEVGMFYIRQEGAVVRYYRNPDVPGHVIHDKCGQAMHDHGWIDTFKGGHIVCPCDWIITGVQGERYPCKPDIFAETYEPI